MDCVFCQNFEISREFSLKNNWDFWYPKDIVKEVHKAGLKAIAYTYNEPTVFYEWVLETALIAKDAGLKNVLVTNGFIEKEPFETLAPFIDAMNIDVKAYSESAYNSFCKGGLAPVLKTIKRALAKGIYVELTCLIVPKLNDNSEEADVFFQNLYKEVGDLYLHISRYFPRYKAEESATSIETLFEIQRSAQQYFSHVNLGNVR